MKRISNHTFSDHQPLILSWQQYSVYRSMLIRSSFRILKPTVAHRRLTQATATLRLSKDVTQEVPCLIGGAPDYAVGISKDIGCALAGRDLGYQDAKVDLIYYDGQHFATGMSDSRQEAHPMLIATAGKQIGTRNPHA